MHQCENLQEFANIGIKSFIQPNSIMRQKVLMLATAGVMVLAGCKKDKTEDPGSGGGNNQVTVEEKQRSMFLDFTATWCGPCGQWGTPTMKGTISGNEDKVVAVAVHTPPNQVSELVAFWAKSPSNDTAFVSPVFAEFYNGVKGL